MTTIYGVSVDGAYAADGLAYFTTLAKAKKYRTEVRRDYVKARRDVREDGRVEVGPEVGQITAFVVAKAPLRDLICRLLNHEGWAATQTTVTP